MTRFRLLPGRVLWYDPLDLSPGLCGFVDGFCQMAGRSGSRSQVAVLGLRSGNRADRLPTNESLNKAGKNGHTA